MKAKYLHAIVMQQPPEVIGYKKYVDNAVLIIEFLRNCSNREFIYYSKITQALNGVK